MALKITLKLPLLFKSRLKCSLWFQCSFARHRKLTISVCPSAGPPELFDAWLSHFCLEEKKGEISELLVGSPSIRALYTKMVRAQPAGPQLALSLRCWEVGGMCVVETL